MSTGRLRSDENLPEAVPSNLPQTYNFENEAPQVVENQLLPGKYSHPQFADSSNGSYTPSPPFLPPVDEKKRNRILGLRRNTFFLSLALAVLVIFGIALGAGLGVGLKKSNNNNNASNSGDNAAAQTTTAVSSPTSSPSSAATTSSKPSTTSSTCNPTATPAIQNGDFENMSGDDSVADIQPWYIVDLTAPATYEVVEVNGTTAFHAICNSDESHGAYTKVKLAQELNTCPNTTYDISFLHNFDPADNLNAYLVVFINGEEIGNIRAAANEWVEWNGNFTSNGNETTLLQLDFAPVDFDSQEFYVDNFTVTAR
ncbi:hypothetical protein TWF694_003732 [Orbilia ellipsospora]|uniref:Uncharacterized protein n=1 Tax=Orbilia ellipsospora TaxID=2528407 RepID=A0AAV9X1A1_9PEZI